MTPEKKEALAKHLGCYPAEIEHRYDETFEVTDGDHAGEEWLVCTPDEAREMTTLRILDSLWAFRIEFLRGHFPENFGEEGYKAIGKMCRELCESANPIIQALIVDLDKFIEAAIASDGKGNFLSDYDSEEIECNDFLMYRTN